MSMDKIYWIDMYIVMILAFFAWLVQALKDGGDV